MDVHAALIQVIDDEALSPAEKAALYQRKCQQYGLAPMQNIEWSSPESSVWDRVSSFLPLGWL